MNGQQAKKCVALSFILSYVFMILPAIINQLNTVVQRGDISYVTNIGDTTWKIVLSMLVLSVLLILIYSDEFMPLFNKTVVGKWINTPYRTRRE